MGRVNCKKNDLYGIMLLTMSGKIIALANQKGGVGKTTTAINLGAYIAERGKKVLLIDFDPQGNLSSGIGADKQRESIYDVIVGSKTISEVVQDTVIPGLQVVPSNINLTGATVELIDEKEREFFLKKSLADRDGRWDYLFIDCPPSLGLLTLNGLAASDYVIVPLQCEYFALEGLSLLLQTIKKVKDSFNPELKTAGILFTMYDSRTRLANDVIQEVTSYFKDKVFKTVIPRNVRLSEAPSHGLPISIYEADCIGAKSYEKLAEEVLSRV